MPHHSAHNKTRVRAATTTTLTEGSVEPCLPSCSTMGKKSREKKAKQLERDRKREEGEAAARVTSDEGSSRSTAHHDTPAAADKPSTDDTQDEPAATAVSASDPTAAVGEKLRAFCDSCVQRLHDDITTWVDCYQRQSLHYLPSSCPAGHRSEKKSHAALRPTETTRPRDREECHRAAPTSPPRKDGTFR